MPIPTELLADLSGPEGNRVLRLRHQSRGVVQIVDRSAEAAQRTERAHRCESAYPQISRVDLPDAERTPYFRCFGLTLSEFAKQSFRRMRPCRAAVTTTVTQHQSRRLRRTAISSLSSVNRWPTNGLEPRQMVRMIDITFESTPLGAST